jgi:glycosyltransferase involved in cell wall biosynthesis
MSRILSISWYKVLPPKYGGQKGIALFTKYLSQIHQVVLLCSKNNELSTDMPFQIKAELPNSRSQFLNPFCWRKIVRIASEFQPGYIIVEHPYHGIAGYRACKKTGAKLIVHSHNIESQRFRELGKWWWKLFAKYERWVHRKADLNLFKTENDLQWAAGHFGLDKNKCTIVPFGIEDHSMDKERSREIICKKHNITRETKLLLFAGTLDYGPNARAVDLIFKEIAPGLKDDDLKILICGRNNSQQYQYLKKLTHPNVLYVGEVEDIENYFAAADVFLDPVETGGGIQTKVIEALSYNLNIVCFKDVADEQFIVAGEKIFVGEKNDYDAMTKNIYSALGKSLSTRPEFFEYYSWINIVNRLNKKLTELAGNE